MSCSDDEIRDMLATHDGIAKQLANFRAQLAACLDHDPPPPPPPPPPTGDIPRTITTHHHTIPVYGWDANMRAVKSGLWSDPATWGGGGAFSSTSRVLIPAGVTVTIDGGDLIAGTLLVQGSLIFSHQRYTVLDVGTLFVLPEGKLTIGDVGQPVRADTSVTIDFMPVTIDRAFDPDQWGGGAVLLGTTTIYGAVRTPFVRLAKSPVAGDQSLSLAGPVEGWRPGDQLYLPDSRQLRPNIGTARTADYATVKSVSADGLMVMLESRLNFNHPGWKNRAGETKVLPHVVNLIRNVVFHADHDQAHVILHDRCFANINHAAFVHLGRTRWAQINAANPKGRYPLHFHHVMKGNGVAVRGCVIDGVTPGHERKWGLVIHDTHNGIFIDNVVHVAVGAGIVTEDGDESGNRIVLNFVGKVWGSGARSDNPDWGGGNEGCGIWLHGPLNVVDDNVVCEVRGEGPAVYAYVLYFRESGVSDQPIKSFKNNECYCVHSGLTLWDVGTFFQTPKALKGSILEGFVCWHHTGTATSLYENSMMVFRNWKVYGDWTLLGQGEGATGIYAGDYLCHNFVVQGLDAQGLDYGIAATTWTAGTVQSVEDCVFDCNRGVVVPTMWTSNPDARTLEPRRVEVHRSKSTRLLVSMDFDGGSGRNINLVVRDQTFVYDAQQQVGDSFQVYYAQQASFFVVPQTIQWTRIGCPEAGLTNAQALAKHRVAIGGEVAPANASRRQDVGGLVMQL